MWHTGEGMAWWMVFGGLLWIAFSVSVVYLIVTLVRRAGPSAPAAPDDPIAI